MLNHIDDKIILEQRHMQSEHKLFALEKKHGVSPTLQFGGDDAAFYFGAQTVVKLSQMECYLDFIEISGSRCKLEGYFGAYPLPGQQIAASAFADGQEHICEMTGQRESTLSLGETILERHGFCVEIPLAKGQRISSVEFYLTVDGHKIRNQNLVFGKYFPLSLTYENAYSTQNGWQLSRNGHALCLQPAKVFDCMAKEAKFLKEIWNKNLPGGRKAVAVRCVARLLKCFKRKPIWLISDRMAKADDNGEALFCYMQKEHPEIKTYFVLESASPDFERLKTVGPVLAYPSMKHKMELLLADRIISSQVEEEHRNPFGDRADTYKDMLAKIPFVFLQHGITKDDISGWINRYNKNFAGIVTAAVPEYTSFFRNNYQYGKNSVWSTGFPRFDRLYHKEEKCIAIMPTWRKYLMETWNIDTDTWSLVPDFQESEYFKFYNGLINDTRLIQAAKQYGYNLLFLPHPTMQPHLSIFRKNDYVQLLSRDVHYRDVYAKSNLVVSDYSSAVFDFAYLRKPIVYCHFDSKSFFAGSHVYTKGYFDYERDGFGEVEYDLESTVDRIIEYMQNGCQLKDKYRERIDKFFAFNDRNNCQRVYEKIQELE